MDTITILKTGWTMELGQPGHKVRIRVTMTRFAESRLNGRDWLRHDLRPKGDLYEIGGLRSESIDRLSRTQLLDLLAKIREKCSAEHPGAVALVQMKAGHTALLISELAQKQCGYHAWIVQGTMAKPPTAGIQDSGDDWTANDDQITALVDAMEGLDT